MSARLQDSTAPNRAFPLPQRPIALIALITTLLALLASFSPDLTPPAHAAAEESRYFPETGATVSGRFLAHWEANGGLARNGYPLADERVMLLEDGKEYLVQYFERVRMEYHPENPTPYDVLLGHFGRLLRPADPPVAPVAGARHFPESGHNVTRAAFVAYWEANGGLVQFGNPISEEFTETLEDGERYSVQYFERARFEWHPENADPNQVLLGHLGRRIFAAYPGEPLYQVGIYVSDDTPPQGSDLTVVVDVGRNYQPFPGYRIETTWHFPAGPRTCDAPASEPGHARCTLNIGTTPAGIAVAIDATAILPDGTRLTTQTTFTPRLP